MNIDPKLPSADMQLRRCIPGRSQRGDRRDHKNRRGALIHSDEISDAGSLEVIKG